MPSNESKVKLSPKLRAYLVLELEMMSLDELDDPLADVIRDAMDPIWMALAPEERQYLNSENRTALLLQGATELQQKGEALHRIAAKAGPLPTSLLAASGRFISEEDSGPVRWNQQLGDKLVGFQLRFDQGNPRFGVYYPSHGPMALAATLLGDGKTSDINITNCVDLSSKEDLDLATEIYQDTFETVWAVKESEGYQYGHDALEQVRFGWELARSKVEPFVLHYSKMAHSFKNSTSVKELEEIRQVLEAANIPAHGADLAKRVKQVVEQRDHAEHCDAEKQRVITRDETWRTNAQRAAKARDEAESRANILDQRLAMADATHWAFKIKIEAALDELPKCSCGQTATRTTSWASYCDSCVPSKTIQTLFDLPIELTDLPTAKITRAFALDSSKNSEEGPAISSPRPWRVGSKVPRNIYDANDVGIVMVPTEDDARLIVKAVNAYKKGDAFLERCARAGRPETSILVGGIDYECSCLTFKSNTT